MSRWAVIFKNGFGSFCIIVEANHAENAIYFAIQTNAAKTRGYDSVKAILIID